jgi:phosphoribosylglycinamide formyltransferase-1
MNRLAIFASGSGSNFQAIVDAMNLGTLQAEVIMLVCDKEDAKVIERAQNEKIRTFVASPKTFETKKQYEEAILKELQEQRIDWMILAGYMRLIGDTLLQAYQGKIVNIHPSLLPSFPGKDAIGQALKAKVKVTGITVHFVDEGMDTGQIIDQEPIRIEEHDTCESLQMKIQVIEHSLYPNTIKKLVTGGNHS